MVQLIKISLVVENYHFVVGLVIFANHRVVLYLINGKLANKLFLRASDCDVAVLKNLKYILSVLIRILIYLSFIGFVNLAH